NAFAMANGMTDSDVANATYTIQQAVAAAPTFSPGAGTYMGSVTVALSTTTSGATIYYTTDGSTPTTGSSAYSAPILVSNTTTIQAIATASGMSNSSVATAVYTIQAVPPTFNPPGGTYVGTQLIALSTPTA